MNESGRIWVDGNFIRYQSKVYGEWDLPVADLRILGEATNQNGPFADDYFFCFATGPGRWLEASFYADGRDEFLRALGTELGASLETGLCNSTDFASRVLWPLPLAGQPMFHYEDVPPKSLAGRLIGSTKITQTYTAKVLATLAGDG